MRTQLTMAAVIVVGSFLVYCTQDSASNLDGGHADGPVSPADGAANGECCAIPEPPAPTILFDAEVVGDGSSPQCFSPTWDVSAYKSVVVHTDGCFGSIRFRAFQWRYGVAGFRTQRASICDPNVADDGMMILD